MLSSLILPRYVDFVLHTLSHNGFEAYVVGGCVRDSLMGLSPKDYDIATSAKPLQVKSLFAKTFDSGIKHGTVTVLACNHSVEVTTFRVDGVYSDFRHPQNVAFTNELSLDLLRRDFTVNAVAYNHSSGFVDLCSGIDDISNKIIRGVGDPNLRFQEDALRMLRAVRFAAQLGFSIEACTLDALFGNAPLIEKISSERIRDELLKIILSDSPGLLQLVSDAGLLTFISQDFYDYCTAYLQKVLPALSICDKSPALRLAILLQFMDQSLIRRLLIGLRFDNKTINDVLLYVKWSAIDILPNDYHIRYVLSLVGVPAFRDILSLKFFNASAFNYDLVSLFDVQHRFRIILDRNDCISLAQLRIKGRDLLDLGFPKGETVGHTLDLLFHLVLKDPSLNSADFLLAEAGKIFKEKFPV